MGAFDGYVYDRYANYVSSSTPTEPKKIYQYFDSQPSFEFFKGFEMPQLKELLAVAEHLAVTEQEGSDTVWVPQERPGLGRKGLHVWYVKALINEYENN